MKLFLDPNQPLYTCIEESCYHCDVEKDLNCHFNIKQLLTFLVAAFSVFIVAGIGIYSFKPIFLVPWVLFIILYFGVIEIRVMCSHCPHYAEPETDTLKCWANYGSPKLSKYRPGPMSMGETIVFFAGLIFIFVYPYPFLLISKNTLLLILYSIVALIGIFFLRKFLCSRCMNFACPLNRVDNNIRSKFFKHNPEIKNAWDENF
ncbi:MAG: hypothetical protein P8Y62_01255 [candidate division WOR-3 bacterium]|jgi:hypothetical protein